MAHTVKNNLNTLVPGVFVRLGSPDLRVLCQCNDYVTIERPELTDAC